MSERIDSLEELNERRKDEIVIAKEALHQLLASLEWMVGRLSDEELTLLLLNTDAPGEVKDTCRLEIDARKLSDAGV